MFTQFACTETMTTRAVTAAAPQTALSTAFPEFFGRIRMDKATKMFSCVDIVQVVTACETKHACRGLASVMSNYPEFATTVHEAKIDGKVRAPLCKNLPKSGELFERGPRSNSRTRRAHERAQY
jgi:hypothetical protein